MRKEWKEQIEALNHRAELLHGGNMTLIIVALALCLNDLFKARDESVPKMPEDK